MTFLKRLKPLTYLSVGLIAGWALHELLVREPVLISEIEVISTQEKPTRAQPEVVAQSAQNIEDFVESTAPHQTESSKSESLKIDLIQFLSALESGEVDIAVSICNALLEAGDKNCRQKLLEFCVSPTAERGLKNEILNLWLYDHPEDIDATLILVNEAIEEEMFIDAANRLAFVRGYQSDTEGIEAVSWQVQRLARAAMLKLNLREDLVSLKSLLTIFTEIEPNRATWRYSLARILIELNDFSGALEELTFILFDTDYGDRANELYDQVSQRIDLASYSIASLQRTGSQFLVTARLNGMHELSLLLDTGASLTSVRAGKLRELGLTSPSDQEIILNTAGGQIRSTLVQLNSLSVGGQPIRGLNIASLEHFEGEADGLLGMDYLRHFKFVIDQSNRSLHLTPK
ncbi:MAG: retropepsin-like aspartic protease family protein [bacterium]